MDLRMSLKTPFRGILFNYWQFFAIFLPIVMVLSSSAGELAVDRVVFLTGNSFRILIQS